MAEAVRPLMRKFYWIFPMQGDPLPTIGSGMRRVEVDIDDVERTVKVRGPTQEADTIIRLDVWDSIPHVEDDGAPLATVIDALRNAETRTLRNDREKRK